MINQISGFFGDYRFLSNFHTHPEILIYIDDLLGGEIGCISVENAFQALKTLDPLQRAIIAQAATPGAAKKLGKTANLRPDWEEIKIDSMLALLYQKFSHPFYRDLLVATGNAELIEDNSWNDTFWGVCNGVGQNILGKLLMKIRKMV